jgi:hypothetical protein
MKTSPYFLLFLVLLVACGPSTSQEFSATTAHGGTSPEEGQDLSALFRLGKGQAGIIRVGMSVEELKASVPADLLVEKEINREGQLYTVYEILNDAYSQETGLVAEPRCEPGCRIYRIEVRDKKYQTPEGIGIGSTYGEVRQAYPIRYASAEEGNVTAVSEEAQMSFLLEKLPFSHQQLTNLQQENIPDSTLVTGILIL